MELKNRLDIMGILTYEKKDQQFRKAFCVCVCVNKENEQEEEEQPYQTE